MENRTRVRWLVCGLLFFATTINYIDRQTISLLKTTLSRDLGWSETQYADIVFWFQALYAVGYAAAGWLIDRIGVRVGYSLAVLVWSVAAMLHAGVRSVLGFCLVRGALGLAEGGNFPAAVRATAEWFPKKERALAFGILNAGSNLGPVVTPLVVPWLTVAYGWPAAFVATGSLGLIWLGVWLAVYRAPGENPRVSAEELAYIRQEPTVPVPGIPWISLLRYRTTLAFMIGMALSSPVWWFYLFWIPDFLQRRYHFDLTHVGLPLIAIYLLADVGSVGGGWLSSYRIARGTPAWPARRGTMFVCAVCVLPLVAIPGLASPWIAVGLIGLAAAAHQGWSANLYTMVSDSMPASAVSSVVGLGGMAGSVAGMFMAKFVGWILDRTHSYSIPFLVAPAAYLLALALITLLKYNPDPELVVGSRDSSA
jgi:ACS family hexuronate transporter-like MFS transporter